MPITAIEAHQSRKAGRDYREYVYIVTGTDDETEAYAAAAAVLGEYIDIPHPGRAPGSGAMLTLKQTVTIEHEIDDSNPEQNAWRATLRYDPVETTSGEGPEVLNYSIGVGTSSANVKVALEQTKHLASPKTDPGDFGNCIGVIRNGAGWDVQGVDCIFPQSTLEIERRYSRSEWNDKVRQIIRKVGMVNSDPFEIFGEEEVLFAGARVTRGEYISANYQFLISPTEDVDIPGIGSITKKGWRYIWVYSRSDDDKGIGTKAVAAYVARVYKRTSFAGIL